MDPEGYYDLVSKVNKRRDERESSINGVIGQLDETSKILVLVQKSMDVLRFL